MMLENIVRHLDMGKTPLRAALDGSAEVGFTIVSMTVSLVAVFIPVLFLGGIVGRLLREFAVTISVAIVVSGLVSVTLTPMLCALFLRGGHAARAAAAGLLYRVTERAFDLMLAAYARTLRLALRLRLLMLLFSFAFIAGTAYYLVVLPKGFLPSEDTGQIYATTEGPEDVSFEGMLDAQQRVAEIVRQDENVEAFSSIGRRRRADARPSNAGRMFIRLKPRDRADAVGRRGDRPAAAEDGRRCRGSRCTSRTRRRSGSAAGRPRASTSSPSRGRTRPSCTPRRPKLEERLREMPELTRGDQRPADPQPAAQRPDRPRQGDDAWA